MALYMRGNDQRLEVDVAASNFDIATFARVFVAAATDTMVSNKTVRFGQADVPLSLKPLQDQKMP